MGLESFKEQGSNIEKYTYILNEIKEISTTF